MKMIINETGERKTLSLIDQATGVDWANELIGNSGAIGDYIRYDSDADAYLINQDEYCWWADYIDKAEADAAELADMREIYDRDLIEQTLNDHTGSADYNDHHDEMQAAFASIRAAADATNTYGQSDNR